jgi:hypothetical protein
MLEMSILYNDGGHADKWQNPQELFPKPRPRLAGPAHVEGWPKEARALRALLKATHARCPSYRPKGGSERVGLEVIEHISKLDAQSLYLLRFAFAELFKLSVH